MESIGQRTGRGCLPYCTESRATTHEDQAQRAIHAGLEILDTLRNLNHAREQPLEVRIGIATGMLVVGPYDEGAFGETMNLAARLQGIAPPGGIVVERQARRLAAGRFLYEAMPDQFLKGISGPVEAHRVLGVSPLRNRFATMIQNDLTPLVARETEIELLMDRLTLGGRTTSTS